MMSGYTIAWIMYGAGALALLASLWRLLRRAGREWRHLVLVSAAVLLLTPGPMAVEESTLIAPALFVLVLDGLFDTPGSASGSGFILLGVWLGALILSLGYQWFIASRQRD